MERFESVLEQMLDRSEEEGFQRESMEIQKKLKRELDKKGVILISDKKKQLIPKGEVPRVLHPDLGRPVEYRIDTVKERSALEKILSTLEKKKKIGK